MHHVPWSKSAAEDAAIFSTLLFPLFRFTHCSVLWSATFLVWPYHSPQFTLFHFLSLSSSVALALLFRQPLSLPIAAALMKVRTSLNQSDGRWRGDNKRHTHRETERAHGRWLTLVNLICCVCFCLILTHRFLTWGMPLEENCRR